MTPEQFIAKWQHNTLSERAGAQLHFLDLCELLGVDKPGNPNENDNYCFERGARRTGAGRGWADVWKRGHFAWEYKAPGARLDAALKQLMTYALGLDNPPLLVVSDRLHIEIHTHFTDTPSKTYPIALADIGTPANLQTLRRLFTEPKHFKPQITRTVITKQAAELFGDLALVLQQRDHEPHKVAHFLNKILFCMFAESAVSVGSEPLLPNRLLSKVLRNGLKDPKRFEKQLVNLFNAMAKQNGEFGEHIIEWFNGGLFDDDVVIPLTQDDIQKIVNVATLDWSAIEPSIFGTLFEHILNPAKRDLNPAKRDHPGVHYTDPGSIMRIVNPVIVEPLLAEWAEQRCLLEQEIAVSMKSKAIQPLRRGKKTVAKSGRDPFAKPNSRLRIFLTRLKEFRVLDPACGSGNFLYLALQSLKDIEHRVILEAEELGLERAFHQVGPETLHGIEINPYAAELARVTVWIGEIQWMLKHGLPPSRNPILKKLDQIECRDALLIYEDGGPDSGALFDEAQWPKVDVIVGNPPFLGGSRMRDELGDKYTEALRAKYEGRVPGGADLVTYWFEKARAQIEAGQAGRAGLVATNSIRGGANRKVLERILATVIPGRAQREPGIQSAVNHLDSRARGNDSSEGMPCRIYHAWSDEPWINEGAAVRVSILCFSSVRPEPVEAQQRADGGSTSSPRTAFLDGRVVAGINADLTNKDVGSDTFDITKVQRLLENTYVSFQGASKKAKFEIEGALARKWLALPNPHGKPNSDVVRPWANGFEISRRPQDMWIIDFGLDRSEKDAALYEQPFSQVLEHVKPVSTANRDVVVARNWWRLARPRPDMRAAMANCSKYVATIAHAKYRLFVWFDIAVLPDQALIVFARSDDIFFGILHSHFHELWSLRMGTSLEDRPRYTPTTCFETFPFPEGATPNLKPEQYTNFHAAEIAAAAQRLNELRENWLNPAEWVEHVPAVVPGYPERVIPKPEYAKAIRERTLTNLYNKRAKHEVQWLEDAHRALDAAVARAYGWDDYTPAMPDEEILRRLLALNLQRAGKA